MQAEFLIPSGASLTPQSVYNESTSATAIHPAFIVWYNGPGAPSISLSSTSYTFKVDAAADTSVGTAGVFDISNAAYDTVGEFVDALNADTDGYWHAYVCAALRATPTFSSATARLVDFSNSGTAFGKNVTVPVYLTAVSVKRYLVIGPEGNARLTSPWSRVSAGSRPSVIRSPTDVDKGWSPRTQSVATQVIARIGNAGTAAAGTVKFFSADQSGETQLGTTYALADAVTITKNVGTDFAEFALASAPNRRLLMEIDILASGALSSFIQGFSGYYFAPLLGAATFPG